MNVLLTNPNYKHTWALASHFHKKGHKVYCLSKTKFSLLTASKFLEKVIYIDSFTKENCELIFRDYSIDIIVPVGFEETLFFSKFVNSSKFKKIITVSNYDKVLFASNKNEISGYINELGIDTPEIFDISNQKFTKDRTFFDQKFFIKGPKEPYEICFFFKRRTLCDIH